MLPICLIGRLIAIPADARHVKTMIKSEPAGIIHPVPHFSAIKNQKLKHQFIQRQSQNTACHTAGNRIGERLRRNHPAELIRAHANGPHNAILLCPGRCAGIHAVENIEYRNESKDGLVIRHVADDTRHICKPGQLTGPLAAVARDDFIAAALPGTHQRGLVYAVVLSRACRKAGITLSIPFRPSQH